MFLFPLRTYYLLKLFKAVDLLLRHSKAYYIILPARDFVYSFLAPFIKKKSQLFIIYAGQPRLISKHVTKLKILSALGELIFSVDDEEKKELQQYLKEQKINAEVVSSEDYPKLRVRGVGRIRQFEKMQLGLAHIRSHCSDSSFDNAKILKMRTDFLQPFFLALPYLIDRMDRGQFFCVGDQVYLGTGLTFSRFDKLLDICDQVLTKGSYIYSKDIDLNQIVQSENCYLWQRLGWSKSFVDNSSGYPSKTRLEAVAKSGISFISFKPVEICYPKKRPKRFQSQIAFAKFLNSESIIADSSICLLGWVSRG